MTLGPPFTDVSPAPQLFGVLALALAATLIGNRLGIRSPAWMGVFAVAVGGNPYFLENMSFRFDSGFMALGLLCAVSPFWLAGSSNSVPLVSGAVLLFASLCLYQPTINCYPVVALYLAAQSLAGKPAKAALAFALRCAVPLALAVLAYWLLWKLVAAGFVRYLDAHGQFAPIESALSIAAGNLGQYARIAVRDWGSTGLGLIWGLMGAVTAVILAVRIARSPGRSWPAKIGVGALAIALLAMTVPAAFSAQVFLLDPVFASRTFSGLVMATAVFSAALLSGGPGIVSRLGRILVVAQAVAFVGISYAYANALRAQERYDDRITSAIVKDIQELEPSGEVWTFAISGWTGRSPLAEPAIARYPAIERLVFSVIYQESYWAAARFKTFGLWVKPASVSQSEKMEIICKTTPRRRNAVYDLYLVDKMAFIRFKNDGVKCGEAG
jgi:hypothetical protein